jgi:DNA-binding IclR family transcriptional regulator
VTPGRSPARRRRTQRRPRGPLPLDKALEIIELLATHPAGLTVPEIAARLVTPASGVIRTIAILQRRGWLHAIPENEGISLGPRLFEMERRPVRGR